MHERPLHAPLVRRDTPVTLVHGRDADVTRDWEATVRRETPVGPAADPRGPPPAVAAPAAGGWDSCSRSPPPFSLSVAATVEGSWDAYAGDGPVEAAEAGGGGRGVGDGGWDAYARLIEGGGRRGNKYEEREAERLAARGAVSVAQPRTCVTNLLSCTHTHTHTHTHTRAQTHTLCLTGKGARCCTSGLV